MEMRDRVDPSIREYVGGVYKANGRDGLNCEAISQARLFESELEQWNEGLDEREEFEIEMDEFLAELEREVSE